MAPELEADIRRIVREEIAADRAAAQRDILRGQPFDPDLSQAKLDQFREAGRINTKTAASIQAAIDRERARLAATAVSPADAFADSQ